MQPSQFDPLRKFVTCGRLSLADQKADTDFSGIAEVSATNLTLSDLTIWHDMHFVGDFEAGQHTLLWVTEPTVGEWGRRPRARYFGPYRPRPSRLRCQPA